MPQRRQKWALAWSAGERFFRSPSATLGRIIKQAISPFFAVRSLLLHCTARETDGGITDRVIDAFAPFEGLALRHIEDDRSSCSIGVLAAFEASVTMAPQGGRWRSKKALSSAPKAHFWPLLGTYLGKEAKSSENGRVKPLFGRSEQATTPGFTTHTLYMPGGVHTNYCFLPLYKS